MDDKLRGLKAIDEITDVLIKYELSNEIVLRILNSIESALKFSRLCGCENMFVKEKKYGKKKKSRKW